MGCGCAKAEGKVHAQAALEAGQLKVADDVTAAPGTSHADIYSSKEALCEALSAGHTVFVDAQWFVEQHRAGGRILKRQDMERDFGDSLVKSLEANDIWDMRFNSIGCIRMDTGGKWLLIAISYPWLAPEHPDPDGSQLAELARYMGQMIAELEPHGIRVAAFLDYISLYQETRTPEQQSLFKQGLRNVNLWYGHQSIQVWALTHTATTRPYHDRGWTTFEWAIALLSSYLVFDLSKVDRGGDPLLGPAGSGDFVLGSLAPARVKAEPPRTPEDFNGIVEGKSFTNGTADLPFVQRKYEETMRAILGAARELDYADLAWTEEQFERLALGILPVCGKLRSLNLSRCDGVTDISLGKVVQNCPKLQSLNLTVCSAVTDVGVSEVAEHCPNLQSLNLYYCSEVTDIGVSKVARQCPKLQDLNLDQCYKVTDMGVCQVAEHCPKLQSLSLIGCSKVTDIGVGKVAERCRDLRELNLFWCSVSPDAVGRARDALPRCEVKHQGQ